LWLCSPVSSFSSTHPDIVDADADTITDADGNNATESHNPNLHKVISSFLNKQCTAWWSVAAVQSKDEVQFGTLNCHR